MNFQLFNNYCELKKYCFILAGYCLMTTYYSMTMLNCLDFNESIIMIVPVLNDYCKNNFLNYYFLIILE